MERNIGDIRDFREQIYSMTRRIIEEKFPDELLAFEMGWNNLWDRICQLKDKDPHEWKIEDLRDKPTFVFSYPSEAVNFKFKILGMVIAATINDLIRLEKEPSKKEIEEIIEANIRQANTPESVSQEVFARVLKAIEDSGTEIPKIAVLSSKVQEKKEYWIYSHEKPSKPYPASKEEVEKLEKLSLEEKGERFNIYFNDEKNEVIIQGIVKDFSRGRKEATQLKKLLYLFLSHVGGFVGFAEIGWVIWGDEMHPSPDIYQLKDRLIKFTEETIKPFIMSGKSLIGKDDQDDDKTDRYYIKESSKGKTFKYCMILCKKSINPDED